MPPAKTKTVTKSSPYGGLFGQTEETYDPEVIEIPFENEKTIKTMEAICDRIKRWYEKHC